MKCPFCTSTENKVIDSRLTQEGEAIRRRRSCLECERRFTTYERVEAHDPLVVKRDGRRQPYDRAKVVAGLLRACQKRPVALAEVERIAEEITAALQVRSDREVPTSAIGDLCLERLRRIDEVAYVRFASVYRAFADIEEFRHTLEDLELPSGGEDDAP
ncbi:MAG: transcriptional regulator NrdR [Deltaproteobacteria bacterium]|nr:transcriptional regulator NrdR [Deltaproteobacteria bacterium]